MEHRTAVRVRPARCVRPGRPDERVRRPAPRARATGSAARRGGASSRYAGVSAAPAACSALALLLWAATRRGTAPARAVGAPAG
ncbi:MULTISPECIES: hypothetical protein [unclassified Streptomyces]|uniref:hypothetical protein n=1 Tax=unclassified Streptomyces TaxID=2593676 RepID=UPI0037027AA9